MINKESIIVKPECSTFIEFCTRLTTLTNKDVENGIKFQESCSILRKEYSSKERLWASYGDYDGRKFERQCKSFNVPYLFGLSHLNIKTFFAIMNALPHEIGMSEALKMLNLPLEGTHHLVSCQAYNVVKFTYYILHTQSEGIEFEEIQSHTYQR